MLAPKKIIISTGSLYTAPISISDNKNIYQEDENKIYIDICTEDGYSEFEQQTRKDKWGKLHDPTQIFALTIIVKITIALLLLEIFLNQTSNSIFDALKNNPTDSTSIALAALSILVIILTLLINKKENNIEISQIRSIILATLNENRRATILASKLAKKISKKNKEIEIWLHTVNQNSWTIKGLVHEVITLNKKSITIHIKKQNKTEFISFVNEANQPMQLNIEFTHGLDADVTPRLESINRTYNIDSETIAKCLSKSILNVSFIDGNESPKEENIFSATRFELEICKSGISHQASLIIYDLIHNYHILKIINKDRQTLIENSKLTPQEITHVDLNKNPDAIELMIILNISSKQKDRQEITTELINRIIKNEDYTIFNKWLNSSEETSKKLIDGITPETVKKASTCLMISSQYDLANKICEAMLPYKKEEYKALSAFIAQRKEDWTNREASINKFRQVDTEKLSKENHETYIEFLLYMTWSLIDQEHVSEPDLVDAQNTNTKAIFELESTKKIYPDLLWHSINNEATILGRRGELAKSIEKHEQAAVLMGCSDKWRSGSMSNLAQAYLTLYKQSTLHTDLDSALKFAQQAVEIKKSIGDEDEIKIAQRTLDECAHYT